MNNKQLTHEKAQPLEGAVPPPSEALDAGRTPLAAPDAGQRPAGRVAAPKQRRTTWRKDVIWSCGLPRAYPNHHTAKGRAYRVALEAVLSLYPTLPRPGADQVLREYGKVAAELGDATGEQAITLRNQLQQLLYQLAVLANGGPRKAQPAQQAEAEDLEAVLARAAGARSAA